MATNYIGSIPEFNADLVKWEIYAEQVENFFQANGITDANKKRAVLLSTIGSKTYGVLRNLTAPATPIEKSLKELLKLLQEHYAPRPNPIVQRCQFYGRNRQPGERVAVYLAELRALADQCEFEGYLETALRDRLITGIADDRIQRRLLSEPYNNLTLAKAVDIAVAMETASQNVTTLQQAQGNPTTVTVNALHQQQNKKGGDRGAKNKDRHFGREQRQQACSRCGDSRHKAPDCKFKTAKCFSCGKIGHIDRACRTVQYKDGGRQQPQLQRKGDSQQRRVHQIESSHSMTRNKKSWLTTSMKQLLFMSYAT